MAAANTALPPPFIGPEELASGYPGAVLVDVRWSADGVHGRAGYLEGTVPGAVFADFDAVSKEPGRAAVEGRRPLADPARFAEELGALGISHDDLVIAFDQGPGAYAARLVWMLRAIGQPAAVLDGGLAAWPGPLEPGGATRPPVTRAPVPWPGGRLVTADELAAEVTRPEVLVIDARSLARYRGEQTKDDDEAPGHIPGAVSAPYLDQLAAGRLRPLAELRTRYEQLGAFDAEEVIAYCGSGVTACHDLLALEALGLEARLFVGSWSAWSADPARPVATGPEASGS